MCHLCDISEVVQSRQPTRRRFLTAAGGIAAGLAFAPSVFAKEKKPPPKPQNVIRRMRRWSG